MLAKYFFSKTSKPSGIYVRGFCCVVARASIQPESESRTRTQAPGLTKSTDHYYTTKTLKSPPFETLEPPF